MKSVTTIGFILCAFISFSQVGIGTTTPDPSASLEIQSTNSGLLIPRLDTAQRNAIANPANGLLIFDTTVNSFHYNFGSPVNPNWKNLSSSSSIQSGTYNVGTTITSWQYFNVTFSSSFTNTPSIVLTFREGTGIDNIGSSTLLHLKVANASPTGFTIAIYEKSNTSDLFVDWVATEKTQ